MSKKLLYAVTSVPKRDIWLSCLYLLFLKTLIKKNRFSKYLEDNDSIFLTTCCMTSPKALSTTILPVTFKGVHKIQGVSLCSYLKHVPGILKLLFTVLRMISANFVLIESQFSYLLCSFKRFCLLNK